MAKQTRAQLIALLNSKILTGGNRTKAQDIRDFENAIIESVVNILDGENLPDGYMGIDPAGFADPSFIKAPSPIGYFLKDDGTWGAAGGSGIQSVTGPQVDNTDPLNPIVDTPTLTETIAEDTNANNLLALKSVNDAASNTTILSTHYFNFFVQGSGTLLKGTLSALRTLFHASPVLTGTTQANRITMSTETASTVAYFDASKAIKSLPTTTYPDLIEFSYAKGVTSSIQTQLDEKLIKTNNLSDVSNALTARNNLSMYDMFITTGDQSTTSNVASAITDLLTVVLEANKRYYFDGFIRIGCNNTGGVKFQITLPTGATVFIKLVGASSNLTSQVMTDITASASLTSNVFSSFITVSGYVKVTGEIQMSSTPGAAQFGFASNMNGQTSTIYQLGTNIKYYKLD